MSEALNALAGHFRPLIVRLAMDQTDVLPDLRLMERMTAHGVRHFFVPPNWVAPLKMSEYIRAQRVFIDSNLRLDAADRPIVWRPSCVVWTQEDNPARLKALLEGADRPELLVVTSEMRDPRFRGRRLCEMQLCATADQIKDL
jgi:hypothetical protein